MSTFPESVQRYLRRESIAPAPTASLSFDGDWHLLARAGDLTAFGLEALSDEVLERRFRELCIGQSLLGGTRLNQLDVGDGHSADVHLVAEQAQVHVVLIDVRSSVERERSWQQNAQEAKLRSYEQGRQLRELRQQRVLLESERDGAKAQVAELTARAELFDHRLMAMLGELDGQAQRLLALPPEHGGRQREAALFTQSVAQADACRAGLHNAIARINGQSADGDAQIDVDELSAELYASVAAQLHSGQIALNLRLQQHSPEPLRGITDAAAETFHFALWLTLLRSRIEVDAVLRWDGQFVQLQLDSDADDFDLKAAELLWDQRLPGPNANALERALFGLGRCAQRYQGRVLEQRNDGGKHRLLVSLASKPELPSGDITSPGFIGPLGLVSADSEYAEEWVAQLAARGIDLSIHPTTDESLRALYNSAPPAMIFDLDSAPDGRSMAYKMRARGYPGMLLALGSEGNAMSGSMATTWSDALPRDCTVRRLLRTLAGRSTA